MSPAIMFGLQSALGYVAWLLCFRTYIWPRLSAMEPAAAHGVIASLHSFRFFGLVFVLPGFVGAHLPMGFAVAAAYGDFATSLLAILALMTIRIRPLFWTLVISFNLLGAIDILVAYYHGSEFNLPALAGQLGAGYAIPVLYVPLLMISHTAAFRLLARRHPKAAAAVATHAPA